MTDKMIDARVLLVDDDKEYLEIMEKLMKPYFTNCTCVQNGRAGMEEIMMNDYDIIVSDYSMPIMNGKDFAKCAQVLSDTVQERQIPFILHTAYMDKADQNIAADVILEKPTNFEKLLDTIKEQLEKRKQVA